MKRPILACHRQSARGVVFRQSGHILSACLAQQDPPASRSRASLTCHATSGITPKSALRFIARSRARKKVKRVQTLGSATVDAVTIVNPAVRLTLCTWIGCDAVAFILRLLAGAGRFVFKRIVALIRLHGACVWIVEVAVRPAAVTLWGQRR